MNIKIEKGPSGAWFWKMSSSNGQILATSETYSSHAKAKQTAQKVAQELSVIVKVI